jgi:hypothetical protein
MRALPPGLPPKALLIERTGRAARLGVKRFSLEGGREGRERGKGGKEGGREGGRRGVRAPDYMTYL